MDGGDKGLELSLGLPCSASPSRSKEKSENSSDVKTDTDERTSKILNDFKNFLNAGVSRSFHRVDSVKSQENVVNTLSRIGNISGNGRVSGYKRKNMFDETNSLKRQETETHSHDLKDKGNASNISITTDEGSTSDNEDVDDSEAEGSTSQVFSQCGVGSKTPASKQVYRKANIGGPHIAVHLMNHTNVPLSISTIESPSSSAPSTSSRVPNMTHASPWGIRALSTSVSTPATYPSSSESTQQSKGHTKQLVSEGSSSHSEANTLQKPNSFTSKYPSIRPGIGADVKFSGSGSFPNLPWVSTTGWGPNGKTISGVTYKCSPTQIKIVCACHGIHMSPDEFVLHASDDQPSRSTTPGFTSLLSSSPAAFARS